MRCLAGSRARESLPLKRQRRLEQLALRAVCTGHRFPRLALPASQCPTSRPLLRRGDDDRLICPQAVMQLQDPMDRFAELGGAHAGYRVLDFRMKMNGRPGIDGPDQPSMIVPDFVWQVFAPHLDQCPVGFDQPGSNVAVFPQCPDCLLYLVPCICHCSSLPENNRFALIFILAFTIRRFAAGIKPDGSRPACSPAFKALQRNSVHQRINASTDKWNELDSGFNHSH